MKYILLVVLLFSSASGFSADTESATKDAAPKSKPAVKGAPSKEIQFDDSVVEGMNQVSKDSLETVAKHDATARGHLYVKRTNFKEEIQQVAREIGELP